MTSMQPYQCFSAGPCSPSSEPVKMGTQRFCSILASVGWLCYDKSDKMPDTHAAGTCNFS